ncbi:MAG: HAMP domain-containing histidine kinase [Bacteroidetes bacterium]|nr:HAMP domain-containing histidine kinase [Bacteroidota bacterium]
MKLLHKSLRYNIFFAILVLIIAVPLLYFSMQHIIKDEADESLYARKSELMTHFRKKGIQDTLQNFTIPWKGFELMPVNNHLALDSIYTQEKYDSLIEEVVPYRILETNMLVQDKHYRIRLTVSIVEKEELIEGIVKMAVIVLACIIAGLYLINWYVSKKIWKPFYKILHTLNHFRVDAATEIVLPKSDVSEFSDLNTAIKNLANTNLQVYKSQKEFTENASHEMQTPLAMTQAKIDLLMQTIPLTEQQCELISGLSSINRRISLLNKNLLLLAKLDNNQFVDRENISVIDVCKKVLEQYKFQADQKNIELKTEWQNDRILSTNKILFEILLGNLMNNAIRHNQENGKIVIQVLSNAIVIANTSSNKELNTNQLFRRFQKQSNETGGTGLGLTIAKKIADYMHWDLKYNYVDTMHQFSIEY